MTAHDTRFDRRTVLKTTAGLVGAAALPFSGTASATAGTSTVDDALDTATSDLQEVLVVFDAVGDADRLRHLALVEGYHAFETLPIGYAVLTGDQIATVAEWPEVRYVEANRELSYYNDDASDVTGADEVQAESFYTGETVSVAVIDSGVDGDHPDLVSNLEYNFQYTDPLDRDTVWVDAGEADTDSIGHGTHCAGSIGGDGTASDGKYEGMAPDASITFYAAGATLLVVQAVAAYDDLVAKTRAGELDVQLVSNSYGTDGGDDFNPNGALETATYVAFEDGILSVFAASNSGPGTNTLNDYAKAPHVLGVGATDDDMYVTDFSSRGRTPDYTTGEGAQYDRRLALSNLRELHASSLDDQPVVQERSFSGTVGPGVQDSTTGVSAGESAWEEWTAPSDAGFAELTVSWTPTGQDIDVYLHEESRDGPVVASGASLNNPEVLESAVTAGETYHVEIVPYTTVTATYTVDVTAREALPEDLQPTGPYGIYRVGVAAPGDYVMSTMSPDDPLQAYAAGTEHQDTLVYYGAMSGTSMATPVTSGVTALVYDAFYQSNGRFPTPTEAIDLLEATADDARPGHTPWTAGTGFVDAVGAVARAEAGDVPSFDEVDLAVEGEVTDPRFVVSGARSDDGSVFTAGQTDQVTLTLAEATADAVVRDRIPFDWTVVGGDAHAVYTDDGNRYVEFEAAVADGEAVSYFVEAPSGVAATGDYAFGPAEARPADGGGFQAFTDAETNTVAGEDTNR